MPLPKLNVGKAGGGLAAAIAAMAMIASPIYTGWEGKVNTPYKDIVGVWTVCSGDTRNVTPGKRETDAECDQRTQNILTEYGTEVAKLSPGIEKYPLEFAAHTIFTANVGVSAYSKSSVRREYNLGHHRLACRSMLLYNKAGGKVVVGLANRRTGTTDRLGEYELCLGDAVERDIKPT